LTSGALALLYVLLLQLQTFFVELLVGSSQLSVEIIRFIQLVFEVRDLPLLI
jgi:hypothetical protein